jgi:hypothetical protein
LYSTVTIQRLVFAVGFHDYHEQKNKPTLWEQCLLSRAVLIPDCYADAGVMEQTVLMTIAHETERRTRNSTTFF